MYARLDLELMAEEVRRRHKELRAHRRDTAHLRARPDRPRRLAGLIRRWLARRAAR